MGFKGDGLYGSRLNEVIFDGSHSSDWSISVQPLGAWAYGQGV